METQTFYYNSDNMPVLVDYNVHPYRNRTFIQVIAIISLSNRVQKIAFTLRYFEKSTKEQVHNDIFEWISNFLCTDKFKINYTKFY